MQTALFDRILLDPEALRMLLFCLELMVVMLCRPACVHQRRVAVNSMANLQPTC